MPDFSFRPEISDYKADITAALFRRTKVLVVSNDGPELKNIVGMLKDLNFVNIETAPDGLQALDGVFGETFNLVICGETIDSLTPSDLLVRMRAEEKLKIVPFITIVRRPMPARKSSDAITNPHKFLARPFTRDALEGAIKSVLRAAEVAFRQVAHDCLACMETAGQRALAGEFRAALTKFGFLKLNIDGAGS